ncbi:AbgT family transporter [Chromobacterium alticapitis]|uniref:Aminobenzoyl-glutamate transporter n=1 Tax=Chromobacterium alticapitis TaxID=2073169 RepID=A0A2S5DJN9_9NEIS|nr:AbgT family transporter [Chromobacterium alticapitis]POZ63293.1 hypothetical protein C2I19_05695 [Chromobacterium alticapitis]
MRFGGVFACRLAIFGLRRLVSDAPKGLLTPVMVFIGVLSNVASDVGYVVVISLVAMLFAASGRGSASAKWALLAPIFVPMLMLMGLSPEATQLAYRIGDSVTNIVTPLMTYFPMVLVVAKRYLPQYGLGNLIALMLPYSALFTLAWSLMLVLWLASGLPIGPGAASVLPLAGG